METLQTLEVRRSGINDLTGLQFAINLRKLVFKRNYDPFSDISPIAGLVNLETLRIGSKYLSDLSPLAGLINLRSLHGDFTRNVSDLSPLAGLINLEWLHFDDTSVSDISPLAGLINLKHLGTWGSDISELSPIAGLTKLRSANICGAELSDLMPLSGLPNLTELYLRGNGISDISPLARLTGLNRLQLKDNRISDISPLAGLTNLKWLNIYNNKISDISALAGLTNLTWLDVARNEISDFSPLDGVRENIDLISHANPGFPKGGPKIEGPWLWMVFPDTRLDSGTDLLAEASGGSLTEEGVSTHGATEGKPIGDDVWVAHRLPPTGWNNMEGLLKSTPPDGVIYGTVSLYSPRHQDTTMYVGSIHGVKVWLNGALISEHLTGWWHNNYSNFFPVTLRQGRNVLLVAVATRSDEESNAFFGFESGTEYTAANPSVDYVLSETSIHVTDTFTLDIRAENVIDLAGWQFDIAFDPATLEAIEVSEGDFLKTDGGSTFFQSGRIDNAAGKITGLIAGRISEGGVSGSGSVLQVRFKAKSEGETELALRNFLFGSNTEESIPAGPLEIARHRSGTATDRGCES